MDIESGEGDSSRYLNSISNALIFNGLFPYSKVVIIDGSCPKKIAMNTNIMLTSKKIPEYE